MKMNKLCSNVDQSNPDQGGFTEEEKQTMRNNIDASQIKYNNALADMSITTEMIRPYMNTKYSASVGGVEFLLLPDTFADGMVIRNNGSLRTQAIPTGLPVITQYSASFGNEWRSMRKVDSSISSGTIMTQVKLSTPIQLTAGKKYLISPVRLYGNVEQTKTSSVTSTAAYSIMIWLWDSSKTMSYNSTAVIIGEAEITNHNHASIGQYPPTNGVYRGSFAPTDAIISPTQNLSLDTLQVNNNGNISFGFSSVSPATLVMDHRISAINVMEIE